MWSDLVAEAGIFSTLDTAPICVDPPPAQSQAQTASGPIDQVVPPPPSRTPFRPTTRAIDSQRIDSERDDELLLLALRFEDDSLLSDQAIRRPEIEEEESEEEPLAYEEAFASLVGQA